MSDMISNPEEQTAVDIEAITVSAVFADLTVARQATAALQAAGYAHENITVTEEASVPQLSAEQTSASRAWLLGLLGGGVLGLIAGFLLLAGASDSPLQTLGPLIGALLGAAIGGLGGSYLGLGKRTRAAQHYEAAVRSGATTVTLRAPNEEAALQGEQLLRQHGAQQVTRFSEVL
jgi:hypothetical protein